MTVEIFTQGVVPESERYEYAVSVSPDFDEIYFLGNKEDDVQIVYFQNSKMENGLIL